MNRAALESQFVLGILRRLFGCCVVSLGLLSRLLVDRERLLFSLTHK